MAQYYQIVVDQAEWAAWLRTWLISLNKSFVAVALGHSQSGCVRVLSTAEPPGVENCPEVRQRTAWAIYRTMQRSADFQEHGSAWSKLRHRMQEAAQVPQEASERYEEGQRQGRGRNAPDAIVDAGKGIRWCSRMTQHCQ